MIARIKQILQSQKNAFCNLSMGTEIDIPVVMKIMGSPWNRTLFVRNHPSYMLFFWRRNALNRISLESL